MRHLNRLLLLVILACFSGCGGGDVKSGGLIKFENETPLTEGVVYFVDAQREYYSRIQNDGSYAIGTIKDGDGLPPGQYQVYVTFPSKADPGEYPVDKKFTVPETSGWKVEVKSGGKNQFDFTVASGKEIKESRRTLRHVHRLM